MMTTKVECVNDFEPRTAVALRAHGQDTIAVLYPLDYTTKNRSGLHPGKTVTPAKNTLEMAFYFQIEGVSFSGIRQVAPALIKLADERQGFIVRGTPGIVLPYNKRTKLARGKLPAPLWDTPLHLLPVDADGWPNEHGLDPRTNPEAVQQWMLEVLGPEFVGVTALRQWSTSCSARVPVGTAPAKIDARYYFWLDKPLNELGVRNLLKRMSARVKAYFTARGLVCEKKSPVDPKVADTQQPIFLATPVFESLSDPFPGSRWSLLEGDRDELRFADLDAGLPRDALAPMPKEPGEKRVRTTRTAKGKVRVPGSVLPLAASARLLQAQRDLLAAALAGKGSDEYRLACEHLYHRRAALEMVALALHRGGLQEGERDMKGHMIACALVASVPKGWEVSKVMAEVNGMLTLVAGADWVLEEWVGSKLYSSIVDRYTRASRGERSKRGRPVLGRDIRYAYGKVRLLEEWQPTLEEVAELRLKSLAGKSQRSTADYDQAREEAGAPTRDEWLLAARALAPQAHAMRREGLSQVKIAATLGCSREKVQRLLALDAALVAEMPMGMAQSVAVEAKALEQQSEAEQDLVGAIEYAIASQGLETPADVAAAMRLPVSVVEAAMSRMRPAARKGLRLAA